MRDPERKWRFASWGLGVQSTWMVVLSVLGKLPPIDAALVADTQWERRKTRETFRFYRDYFERNGVRVEVTTVGNIRQLGRRIISTCLSLLRPGRRLSGSALRTLR